MVLVFAETQKGKLKKAAFEAVTYGRKIADALGTTCVALTIGSPENGGDLGQYGADTVKDIKYDHPIMDGKIFTSLIAEVAGTESAEVIVLNHSTTGKSIAGRLAIRLDGALVSGVNSVPDTSAGFKVDRVVFSGKATATIQVDAKIRILTLISNSFPSVASGDTVNVETLDLSVPDSDLKHVETKKQEGSIPLPEADRVVSGGRGFKGPENWDILLELADAMEAATACSRPVADSGWRPHHEHVGQTGVTIRPNLYVAIGISGAIQHLGGVNNSKTIVVVNKDPEAPFFKAADYGVVGDLFDVVPRLTEAVKKAKG